jgi:hypothetical protein
LIAILELEREEPHRRGGICFMLFEPAVLGLIVGCTARGDKDILAKVHNSEQRPSWGFGSGNF